MAPLERLLNDVSTDLDDPPPLDLPKGDGTRTMTDPVRAKARAAYPDLVGIVLPMDRETAFRVAEATARSMRGWRVRRTDDAAGLLTAVAVTPLLRFRDDVTVRVRPVEGGSRVDVRSASRVGRSDFGANAKRIQAFFRALQASGTDAP